MDIYLPVIRGIYGQEEETVDTFKNGVPVFDTVQDCKTWVEQHSQRGSNPDYPSFRHMFTTVVTWNQVKDLIINKVRKLKKKTVDRRKLMRTLLKKNVAVNSSSKEYHDFKPILQQLRSRIDLSFYQQLNEQSTVNTLTYLFEHMRSGILVAIRDNSIKMFVPFANKEYRNNWSEKLETDPPDMKHYYSYKRKYYRQERILQDKSKWWANGNIICNEQPAQIWGDNLLSSLKHMLETLCKERSVPDVDFFINKRDHPQLKTNLTEPYDFVFKEENTPLQSHSYQSYAPIVSFYCSPMFGDIPFPTTEDWENNIGKVFPVSFIRDSRTNSIKQPKDLYLEENFAKFSYAWEEKTDTAFFRGNATGGGTVPDTNQRLRLAKVCHDWNSEGLNSVVAADQLQRSADMNGTLTQASDGNRPLLDAGVTGFNVRDKKLFGSPMQFTKKDQLGFNRSNYIPMYEQGKYKYILYVDGHCAANRYSFLMRLNSVIFKVESVCTPSELWFFPGLKPYLGNRTNNLAIEAGGADHIPIAKDLSNLREMILWCRENDEKCQQIARNAKQRYQHLLRERSILDYLQLVLLEVAGNNIGSPEWFTYPERITNDFHGEPASFCTRDRASNKTKLCLRCKKVADDAELQKRERKRKRGSILSSMSGESNGANFSEPSMKVVKKQEAQCRRCRRYISSCTCEQGPKIPRKSRLNRTLTNEMTGAETDVVKEVVQAIAEPSSAQQSEQAMHTVSAQESTSTKGTSIMINKKKLRKFTVKLKGKTISES